MIEKVFLNSNSDPTRLGVNYIVIGIEKIVIGVLFLIGIGENVIGIFSYFFYYIL